MPLSGSKSSSRPALPPPFQPAPPRSRPSTIPSTQPAGLTCHPPSPMPTCQPTSRNPLQTRSTTTISPRPAGTCPKDPSFWSLCPERKARHSSSSRHSRRLGPNSNFPSHSTKMRARPSGSPGARLKTLMLRSSSTSVWMMEKGRSGLRSTRTSGQGLLRIFRLLLRDKPQVGLWRCSVAQRRSRVSESGRARWRSRGWSAQTR